MPPVPFVGGNWKCNGTVKSVAELIDTLNGAKIGHDVQVAIAPPALFLQTVQSALKEPHMFVAAQNCTEKVGAFTGEIAASQIADAGLQWCILGHSERRSIYGETNPIIAAKTTACYNANLSVIACIGETLPEREKGEEYFLSQIIYPQLQAYADVTKDWSKIVIAYEPVWAIGTGVVASPEQAQAVHESIRKWVAANVSAEVAESIRIIYGGSVAAKNAADLYKQADINGFLVGGASLKAEFIEIINATSASK
jgi:triosephosphate isomerase